MTFERSPARQRDPEIELNAFDDQLEPCER
jgi:hypothetical protein